MNFYPTLPTTNTKKSLPVLNQKKLLELLNSGLQKPMWTLDGGTPTVVERGDEFMSQALRIVDFMIWIGHPPKLEDFTRNVNLLLFWLAVDAGVQPWREYCA